MKWGAVRWPHGISFMPKPTCDPSLLPDGKRVQGRTLWYLDMLLLVAVSKSMDLVVARGQEHMEVAAFLGEDFHAFVEDDLGF